MDELTADIREVATLTASDVARMYALFDRYYEGGSRALFESDLGSKTHLIELRRHDELYGFSTLAVFSSAVDGAGLRAIYSGDTIVDHRYWGQQVLPQAFCRFAGELKAAAPALPLYWQLISKGVRTYRYLQIFARRYAPHHAAPTPPRLQRIQDALYAGRFGASYDAALGLVRLRPERRTRLRPAWHASRASLERSPAVRFFFERNPRYAEGEELACLCELESSNLRSFARRAFLEGQVHACAG